MKFRSLFLAIYNNEFIMGSARVGSEMIKRIATNMSNSYYLSKSHTCHISSVLQHVLKMSSSSTNACVGCWLLANCVFSNRRLRAAHSLLLRHFTSSTYDLKIDTTNVKWIADFQWFRGLGDFPSRHMRHPVWIRCCKRPNCAFCISQGSVATM